ncbi:MAG: UvrD-helicase domain-containing protein [Flavobacteriales bacterium]|nr:UvrD-helicase domain-containing protein [Flavobacteriales bacterium]
MSYLEELNDVQRKAATHVEGPVMVLAGAGSGKTRVLTYRIAHLIESGVDPFNILSLTFTNKAAREMKARISRLVGEGYAKALWMGTFHSIFAKILRYEAEKIGYPSNFTIYDSDDSKSLIRSIIKELSLDDKVYKPQLVQRRISSAKNGLISAAEYQNDSVIYNDDVQAKKPLLGKIYGIYEKRCFKAGAMDFDDLLYKTNILLKNHNDILLKYQSKFRYILVDEFQDTNFAQSSILKMLAARHENICVVGDDAQSIYAFRGANIQNILQFKSLYPDVEVFKLEQNYRSTKTIVAAANQIIANNKEQLKKDVWTSNAEGESIKLIKCLSETEEGNFISNEILDVKNRDNVTEDSFAILYRTNAQSRAIEESLRRKNIHYRIYGGLSFYQRKEIKDLLAYFKLCINPNDEEAFKRVLNYPARGIGKTTEMKILTAAIEEGKAPMQIVMDIERAHLAINAGTKNKIMEFARMIHSFQLLSKDKDAYEVGQHIASATGILKEFYSDRTPEGVSRYENVQELLSGMKEFTEIELSDEEKEQTNPRALGLYMEDVALLTDVDVTDNKDDDTPKVSMMTIHAAKGLEFPYVFIAGLEEDLFPSQLSVNSRADLEEERRLFYVAMTRAEKQAFLSFASTRFRYGNMQYNEPSRFISEIDASLIDSPQVQKIEKRELTAKPGYSLSNHVKRRKLVKPEANAGSVSNADMADLVIGAKVRHDRFGKGEIVGIEGELPNRKATVEFQNIGKKQLLLKFAKLQIID